MVRVRKIALATPRCALANTGDPLINSERLAQIQGLARGARSIALETTSADETEALFGKLADGGEVTLPMQETQWAERFGTCKDKFGVQWMLNFTGSEQFQPA